MKASPPSRHRVGLSPLDTLVLAALAGAVAYVVLRMAHMDYRWQWSVLGTGLLRGSPQGWRAGPLLRGLFTTLRLSLWSGALALVLGLVMGMARVSERPFRRMAGTAYVELVRNLPPLVLIFLGYFFLGGQLARALNLEAVVQALPEGGKAILSMVLGPPEQLPELFSAVLTLGLLEGAYITEIVRAGIQSVERGQWEASCALGFTRWAQLRHVILPQALTRMLPALAGQFISTIKDSAIVSIISVQELTFQGLELNAATYQSIEIWTGILVLYLALTLTCSLGVRRLENRLSRETGWRTR